MRALRAPKLSMDRLRPPEATSAACLNCGTPLTGPFCPNCGQRDIPPYPSVRELAIDAFWELSGWDGRFAATLRALFRRPGLLTREFLEGRRVRYISPLRLYLMSSLVYFLMAAALPPEAQPTGTVVVGGIKVGVSTTSRPEKVAAATQEAVQSRQALSPAQRDSVLRQIERAPAFVKPLVRRAIMDPAGFRRDLLEGMPRVLFALLPVFALIVALFYHGRKYPEHLYFAIHLHSFVFLALSLGVLARFTGLHSLTSAVGVLLLVWIPVYSTLAFRRVYGGTTSGTIAKEVGIGAIYMTASAAALVTLIYVVALRG